MSNSHFHAWQSDHWVVTWDVKDGWREFCDVCCKNIWIGDVESYQLISRTTGSHTDRWWDTRHHSPTHHSKWGSWLGSGTANPDQSVSILGPRQGRAAMWSATGEARPTTTDWATRCWYCSETRKPPSRSRCNGLSPHPRGTRTPGLWAQWPESPAPSNCSWHQARCWVQCIVVACKHSGCCCIVSCCESHPTSGRVPCCSRIRGSVPRWRMPSWEDCTVDCLRACSCQTQTTIYGAIKDAAKVTSPQTATVSDLT